MLSNILLIVQNVFCNQYGFSEQVEGTKAFELEGGGWDTGGREGHQEGIQDGLQDRSQDSHDSDHYDGGNQEDLSCWDKFKKMIGCRPKKSKYAEKRGNMSN